jgi:hypothetical protein
VELERNGADAGQRSGLQLEVSVPLDDEVNAQPLVFNGAVYVVTANNSVYGINAGSGSVIATRNLGKPVTTPVYGCNSGHVGITSTPVIDPNSGTLYVMVYSYNSSGNPVFRLHALNTASLADKIAPRTVAAARRLSGGEVYRFDAAVERQRPGLLLSVDGNVYAGFGSFCDNVSPNIARGWLLGWQRGSLKPVGAKLSNLQAQSENDYFLTGIWMSGSGIAEDRSANLYFSTGNSDRSGTSYNPRLNPSESVIELSSNLTTIESYFTPYGPTGLGYMEANDRDLSSGGVLLTPDGYAVAAGKVGHLFLLRQGNLGGYGPSNFVGTAWIGPCWCGESYYTGSDRVGRIVSSGGNNIAVWLEPSLQRESASPTLAAQDGFFTSVSSNGRQNAIVWAVSLGGNTTQLMLYAYNPATASVVFSAAAGTWPNAAASNPNTVPVVANGHVYIASYQQLTIWGLPKAADAKLAQSASGGMVKLAQPAFNNPVSLAPGEHDIFGTIVAIDGTTISVKKRDGTVVSVDTAKVTTAPVSVDEPVQVVGTGYEDGARCEMGSARQGWPENLVSRQVT